MHHDLLPAPAYLVALSTLPRLGPRRLHALLDGRRPGEAWRLVAEGRALDDPAVAVLAGRDGRALGDRWAAVAARTDVAALWRAHDAAGIGIATPSDRAFPARLRDDPEPPAVLFLRGDPEALAGPAVAVVGTRRCTRYGTDVAHELGRELSRAGVRVVSGLALGIDAAAHAGAVEVDGAPPVAVVATGLDRTYPRRNAALARRVAARGLVLSEYPMGVDPQPWRFPARNRLVAALADVLVVVESHATGGSLYTVDEADRRDRPVMAVPGSIRSPASRGANDLLADGRAPARDVTDVLVELGLARPSPPARPDLPPADLEPGDRALLEALGWEPATLEHLVVRTGREPGALAADLHRLRDGGHVSEQGGWYERVGRR